jgi:hypothetical protein
MRENKLNDSSQPNQSSNNTDEKIKHVEFSFKQILPKAEDQMDFSRQAEAVLRLQKILENKKQ